MCGMYTVKFLPPFTDWLNRLPDRTARLRLSKPARGILGDVKSVGGGIYEMREHFGAGYRMYYIPVARLSLSCLAVATNPAKAATSNRHYNWHKPWRTKS